MPTLGWLAVIGGLVALAAAWAAGRSRGAWRLLAVAVTVTVLAVSVAVVAVLGALRSYRILAHRDTVALVECWPSPSRADEYRLVYRPLAGGRPGLAQVYQLYGDEWTIGGSILVWTGWAQMAGLKACYKITRIEGRYRDAARTATGTPLVYDVNGGPDWLWTFLYRAQAWIPGVEAVYGGSVHMPADPTKQFVVYATPTGLMVKPQRRWPKYPVPSQLPAY